MKLVKSILDQNPCYAAGKKIKVAGLMLHSVGCPQPKASAFIGSWNHPGHSNSCVHAFIDGTDGTVYQTLPWEHRAWHCGSGVKGSGNNTHIGVEMCEPDSIKYTGGAKITCSDMAAAKEVVKRTYEAAVELFAMLCEKYSLDPLGDGVIVSHKEGCDRGIASNHGDPEHLWSQLGTGYTMDGFRKAVREAMNGNAPDQEKHAEKEEEQAKEDRGKVSFQVRVQTPYLNIRKGPGTNHEKTGKHTGIGVFTIVEVQSGKGSDSGWGLLKSYSENKNGWISLDFAKRV